MATMEMYTSKRNITLCLSAVLLVLLPSIAFAEMFMKPTTEIGLALSSQFPEPNSVVTVSIAAYGYDTKSATVSWFINGKAATTSVNQKSIDVPMGGSGESVTVEARFATAALGTHTLKRTITPSSVDIIIEPQTYVPKNYMGRALATPGNPVRVIAVPQLYKGGVPIPKKDILFTWVVNGQTLFGGSQLGTDATTISMPRYGSADITLTVETRDGTRSARNSTTITPTKPLLLFYEDSSLYGTVMQSPKHFKTSKEEVAIRAEPYYMSRDTIANSSLEYTWSVDGREAPRGADPRIISLPKASGATTRNVGVTYMSTNGELHFGRGAFSITFTEEAVLPSI